MKSAKEMFEELGYELISNDSHRLYYVTYKGVSCGSRGIEFRHKFKKIVPYNRVQIDMDLLQAINKQVEELHWNDITVNIDVKLDGKKVIEAMRGGNNA